MLESLNHSPIVTSFFRYWGNSGGFHDYGNIRYYTWRNNMFLELALAGNIIRKEVVMNIHD